MTCSGYPCCDFPCHHKDDEGGDDDSIGHGECNGIQDSHVTYVGNSTVQAGNCAMNVFI